MGAAVGFTVHTGWAAAVVVDRRPVLLARLRIELADEDARFVYHAAAEHGDAERRIAAAARQARERAAAALRPLVAAHAITVAAVAPARRALPALATILAAHPLIHTAEGEL